ncbi:hypothetical protein L2E82_20408 [Cichorium intybus]|uniref:Uncharacterized protein n=1 Tax=Cichorium intybus TaxID=13427 RepID=A0ACB9DTA8_CICIN|nr:hypothetical protein L2E82_20408 [Cichorium intybus]
MVAGDEDVKDAPTSTDEETVKTKSIRSTKFVKKGEIEAAIDGEDANSTQSQCNREIEAAIGGEEGATRREGSEDGEAVD